MWLLHSALRPMGTIGRRGRFPDRADLNAANPAGRRQPEDIRLDTSRQFDVSIDLKFEVDAADRDNRHGSRPSACRRVLCWAAIGTPALGDLRR
jgi:hypothetical protein